MSAACRAAEQRLFDALDTLDTATSLEDATNRSIAATSRDFAKRDAHVPSCSPCQLLISLLAGHADAFGFLARPAPPESLLESLAATPTGARGRQHAADVLSLLTPGALATPEPSVALLARLHALPATYASADPAGVPVSNVRRGVFGRLKPVATDWRFAVAAAYAATFVIVALLHIDPMSAARGAANDLTSAGERALADARVAAVHRFDDSALGRATAPIAKRLDYRVYRAFAAGRARAIAYSQLFYEKVISGTVEALVVSERIPEPSGSSRRS